MPCFSSKSNKNSRRGFDFKWILQSNENVSKNKEFSRVLAHSVIFLPPEQWLSCLEKASALQGHGHKWWRLEAAANTIYHCSFLVKAELF